MSKKVKIQIKSIFGKVLFESSKEGNTTKDTLVEAVKSGVNLRGADFRPLLQIIKSLSIMSGCVL